ncbi:hypothetical protein VNO80_15487 [Phaseolus coccineus]|uniref:Uncharacterized protein n=1 Tax=Phaseolus coccineus TaxID=3886 RepID=A0AAN9MJY7_PHACN
MRTSPGIDIAIWRDVTSFTILTLLTPSSSLHLQHPHDTQPRCRRLQTLRTGCVTPPLWCALSRYACPLFVPFPLRIPPLSLFTATAHTLLRRCHTLLCHYCLRHCCLHLGGRSRHCHRA